MLLPHFYERPYLVVKAEMRMHIFVSWCYSRPAGVIIRPTVDVSFRQTFNNLWDCHQSFHLAYFIAAKAKTVFFRGYVSVNLEFSAKIAICDAEAKNCPIFNHGILPLLAACFRYSRSLFRLEELESARQASISVG